MRVFYYAPDTHAPSWGVGMLYCHVRLLRAHGVEAFVLHEKRGFRPRWLDVEAPRAYRGSTRFHTRTNDVLVIPEVFASDPAVLRMTGRRIVFVQASSYIAPGLGEAKEYRELGYAGAIATMPHVREILERHYGMQAAVVPPCVAPYFYLSPAGADHARNREVALIQKEWCRDFSIVRQMLRDHTAPLGWRLVCIENQSHRQVAGVLRQAAFHVNVNCHESFNASVPEAMAAGCIPICYEAFGGRDYLRDGVNAYVSPTHDAYGLIERALELMGSYDRRARELRKVRRGGMRTAGRYTEAHTEKALLRYFNRLLS